MTDVTERAQSPAPAPRKRQTFADLYHERTTFQFIAHSRRWAIISGLLVFVSIAAFAINGLNLGIDFEGGTQWQFTTAKGSASIDDVRDAIDPLGLGDAKVLIIGSDSARVQFEETSPAKQENVREALAKYAGIAPDEVSITNVGPTWGDKVSSKALQALVVFFAVLALYLSFRFEFRMAISALLAVLHDIIITVGVYALTGFEVTPATVVAFLTILGFSLYDTVVVFDKVKENEAKLGTVPGDTYSAMVNRSLNQVLMRSLNTSIVAVLPVASLLFVGTFVLGGQTLKDFALALFVGLIIGAYSSIFVATPILAALKERQPRFRALRERSAVDLARAASKTAKTPARAGAAPAAVATAPATPGDTGPEDVDPEDAVSLDGPVNAPVDVEPTPAAPSPAGQAPAMPAATRGAANPRPRQTRGKSKKKRR
ncbi:MAG: protein translocase subunit SecF [Acidimicrobiia bacterium]